MKRKNRITMILLLSLSALLVVTMNNCKKENAEQGSNPVVIKSSLVMTEADSVFSSKIEWFDDIMDNYEQIPNYSLNKQFSTDSALWYFESWFNNKYAFPDSIYNDVTHIYTTFSINKSGSNITMNEINSKSASLCSIISTEYNNVNYTKKALLSMNLEESGSSFTEVNYDLHIVIGRLTPTRTTWEPFDSDDAWKYGDKLGKCHVTGFDDLDAAEILEDEINLYRPEAVPPPGYNFSYGPVETKIRNGDNKDYVDPEDPTPQDNDKDSYIFYRTSLYSPGGAITPEEECLEPDAMNYHYAGQIEVIYFKIPAEEQKPANWRLVNCNLKGEYFTDINGVSAIHHKNFLDYAMRHLVRDTWLNKKEIYITD